jgi:large subunit ribosomal protein L21
MGVNMYAIITDGNRQYRVEEGQEVIINYRDVPAGEKITFDRVLAVGGDGDARLGSPLVSGANVAAEVIGPEKGEKLVIQKLRRRKNMRRKTGERHVYTRVRIGKISV